MLFSMKKSEIFPVDIWVRRAMSKAFDIDESDLNAMREFAAMNFGDIGGIAQQYLFYYFREKEGLFNG
jgi:N-glycosylase/DNA lyase